MGLSNKTKGFTLPELIIVIVIFAVIFSSTSLVFGNLLKENSLKSKGQEVVQILREARTNAVSQRGGSAWGVYLNTTANPDAFTIFKGDSYGERDQNYDIETVLPSALSFSNIDLGGGNEIVFSKTDGKTINAGSFVLHTDEEQFPITINALGLVDYSF